MTVTRVVIVGAGFAGLQVAKSLRSKDVDILLIDRMNHHLFQPLLYQVATCALASSDIATPVRQILPAEHNFRFIMGAVDRIDKAQKQVHLADGDFFPYDYLILAPGSTHSYFGNDAWQQYAPGLKTIQDAYDIREKILMAFEKAERAPSLHEAHSFLRFVIVGAGPTGVELAGAIAEVAFKTLLPSFHRVRSDQAKIFLIEGAPHVLPAYPPALGEKAEQALKKLGVIVMTNQKVSDVLPSGVVVNGELLPAGMVIWAAGNQASPLLRSLDAPLDRQGRAMVGPDLTIPGYDHLFVVGDAAHCKDKRGQPLPGLAPVAKQQGKYVASLIAKKIPPAKRRPFTYFDKGSLATIGRGKAVGKVGRLSLSGFFAWLAWSFVHIFYLIGFKNRLLVLIHWAALYLTGRRSVQLITRPLDPGT